MAPRWSESLLFNIGQNQTVGTIRVLTGVDGVLVTSAQ